MTCTMLLDASHFSERKVSTILYQASSIEVAQTMPLDICHLPSDHPPSSLQTERPGKVLARLFSFVSTLYSRLI